MKTAADILDALAGLIDPKDRLEKLLAERDREICATYHGATPAEVLRLRAMERHFDAVILAVDSYRAEGGGRWAR